MDHYFRNSIDIIIVPHAFYFLIITIFIGIPSEGASAEERGIDIAPLTPQINKIVACH